MIGFVFDTPIPQEQDCRQFLRELAREFGHTVEDKEDCMLLSFMHTGGLILSFEKRQTDEGNTAYLVGDFSGCPAGPGYHAYLIQLIDVFVARSGLDIHMVDATGYYSHRDFAELQAAYEHHLRQLVAIGECYLRGSGPPQGMVMCRPLDAPCPESVGDTFDTPTGRFSIASVVQQVKEVGIQPFAKEFFIWFDQRIDGRFYRNNALNMLWEDCCFRPGIRSEEDQKVNETILDYLELAATASPSLPFPKEEYLELCRLNQHPPMDIRTLPPYLSEYPIGYRRGRLDYTIGHVTISIPGSFLYRKDAINGHVHHVFYDAEPDSWRRIRIFSGISEDGDASFIEEMFTLFTDETPEEFPVGNGICRAVSLGRIEEEGQVFFQAFAQVVSGRRLLSVIASYTDPEQLSWAMDMFHGMVARDWELTDS